MNATARVIVELFRETESAEETAAALSKKFGRDPAACLADVRRVLDRLIREGYFERRKDVFPPNRTTLDRLHLNITKECNLSCTHCLGACSPSAETRLDGDLILDLIDQARVLGAKHLTLSGGEPLLHPALKEAIRHGASRMKVQLATNGTLIDDGWAAFFAEVPIGIQISLDGPTAEIHDAVRGPGTFARTLEAIHRLRRAGLAGRLTVASTLMERTIDAVEEMAALARTMEIPFLRFLPLRRSGRAREGWSALEPQRAIERVSRFYDRVRQGAFEETPGLRVNSGLSGFVPQPSEDETGTTTWCPVGTGLLIEAGGEAYPCSLLQRPEFLLGDVRRQRLSEIIESPAWKGIVRTLYARRDRIESCAACLWKNLCQAGCMGLACDRRGTVWATDDFCDYRKRAYADAFEKILSQPPPNGASDARN